MRCSWCWHEIAAGEGEPARVAALTRPFRLEVTAQHDGPRTRSRAGVLDVDQATQRRELLVPEDGAPGLRDGVRQLGGEGDPDHGALLRQTCSRPAGTDRASEQVPCREQAEQRQLDVPRLHLVQRKVGQRADFG